MALYTNADVLGTVISVLLGVSIVIIAFGVFRIIQRRGVRELVHR